jgi:hypothetical protein
MGCQGLFVLIHRNIEAKDSPTPPQWQENCFCILTAIGSELAKRWIEPSPRQAAVRALAGAVDLAWPDSAGQLKKKPYFLKSRAFEYRISLCTKGHPMRNNCNIERHSKCEVRHASTDKYPGGGR